MTEGAGSGLRAASAIGQIGPRELNAGTQVIVTQGAQACAAAHQPANLPGFVDIIGFAGVNPGDPSLSILDPAGPLTIGANGGTDIPAFAIPVTSPPIPSWTNVAALAVADRSHDTEVTFLCRVVPGQGSFTVPSYVLERLPAATSNRGASSPSSSRRPDTSRDRQCLDFVTASAASATLLPVEYR